MFSSGLWLIVLMGYTGFSVFEVFFQGTSPTMTILVATGFFGLAGKTLASFQKNSLAFYFWTLRILHKLRNTKARWRLLVRYDGQYDSNVITNFRSILLRTKKRAQAQVKNVTNLGINFIVNESLNFYLELHPRQVTQLDYDFLSLELSKIEVGYNDAKKKLANEITPFIEEHLPFFRPDNQSYELQVEFDGANPFFSAYIRHLKPEAVDHFQIRLRTTKYTVSPHANSIVIEKDRISISAGSVNGIKELATDFLLLSPSTKKLGRG